MVWAWLVVVLLASEPGGAGASAQARPSAQRIDGLAAVVDGVPIFRSSLAQRARPYVAQERAKRALTAEEEGKLEREVLEQMIEETLIAVDAGRIGLTATEAELAGAIAMVKELNGFDGTRLEAEVQKSGLSFLEYEDFLRHQILEQKWLLFHTTGMDPYLFADEASHQAAYAAERRRLLAGLRERGFVEVLW